MEKDRAATRVTFGTAALWSLSGLAVLTLLGVFWAVLSFHQGRGWRFPWKGLIYGVAGAAPGAVNAWRIRSAKKAISLGLKASGTPSWTGRKAGSPGRWGEVTATFLRFSPKTLTRLATGYIALLFGTLFTMVFFEPFSTPLLILFFCCAVPFFLLSLAVLAYTFALSAAAVYRWVRGGPLIRVRWKPPILGHRGVWDRDLDG